MGSPVSASLQAEMTLTQADFRALFESERDRTFRFLMRLTRNRADAEDLLQESFLTVWRKRDVYEARGSAGGFLGVTEALRQLQGRPLGQAVPQARVGVVSGCGMVNYDRGLCSAAAIVAGGER